MAALMEPPARTGAGGLVEARIDDPRWLEFLQGRRDATIFHHPAWLGLLADYYGFCSFLLLAVDGSAQLRAGLPIVETRPLLGRPGWVSLPFTDYCPVLADSGGVAGDFFVAAIERLREANLASFELRAPVPGASGGPREGGFIRHVLGLTPDLDRLFAELHKMHRRNIRKAERSGVEIRRGVSAEDLDVFYRLHLRTRRRLGVPVQPRSFMHALRQRILANGLGFILTACVEDQPAASAIFLTWNGTLIYKYGASDDRLWEHRPNNLLFWEAIRWAAANGYHTLDFGRTAAENRGLVEFKSGWGARAEALDYTRIGGHRPHPLEARLEQALGVVIRHSPPWVCRGLGELLYRFAA
jgi:CelD/BcsL family acetyltransferase involved in cellulose biosynthesis